VGDQLNQSRYDQLLRRIGDLKGQGSKVSTVLEDLFPVLDVENVPIEMLALMGTRVAFGTMSRGPSGLDVQRIQLFNPIGSQQLVTITKVDVTSELAQQINYGVVTTALATNPATQRFRDSRFGLTNRPVAEIRFDGSGAITPVQAIVTVEASVNQALTDPNGIAVLSEGFGLQFTSTIFGTGLTCTFQWRERVAEPSELNF